MKRLIIHTVFALLLLFTSCKKKFDNSLTGKWKWISSIGGFATHTIKPTSGLVVTINFGSDLSYTTYVNGQKQSQGVYYLTPAQNYTIIHFDKGVITDKLSLFDAELISSMENGKLYLSDYNISDGYGHYFEK